MSDDPTLAVARDLRAIADMADDLHGQAIAKAASKDMPGGLAMVALAPVASPTDAERRGELVEAQWENSGHQEGYEPWVDNDDAWEPPLQTLLFWSESMQDEPTIVTIETEADFLLDNLAHIYATEPHFDDFARDIRAARRRLEDLLSAGERDERTAIPCIDCDLDRDGNPLRVKLVTHYADHRRDGWVCPIEGCRRKGPEDHWWCPRCKRQYDEPALRRAEHEDLGRRGLARFVSTTVAADSLQVPIGVVTKHATACDVTSRSLLVWWPDIRGIGARLKRWVA